LENIDVILGGGGDKKRGRERGKMEKKKVSKRKDRDKVEV
jgi:hypothetical protein